MGQHTVSLTMDLTGHEGLPKILWGNRKPPWGFPAQGNDPQ